MEEKKISKKKIILIIAIILIIGLLGVLTAIFVKNNTKSTIVLTIDQSDFDTQKSTTSLSGTVSSADETILYVSYKVYSELDNKEGRSTGEAEINGDTWKVDKMFLKSGNNEVVIIAETESDSTEKSINIYYDIGKPYELNEENIKYDDETQTNYVNNIVIILFNDDVSDEKKQSIVEQIDGKVVGRVGAECYHVQVSEKTLNELEEICTKLEQFEEVFYAHVDYAMQLTTSTDIRSSSIAYKYWQETGSWGINAIEVPSAWNYKERFSHIDVAVVDDGFDLKHEDLKDVFVPSVEWMKDVNDYKYYDEDAKKEAISSHGTHVAGIIAANSDNKGITGILDNVHIIYTDWRPNRTKQKQSWDTSSRILASLKYSVEAGAKVINYSVGADGSIDNRTFVKEFDSNRAKISYSQSWKDNQAEMSSKYMYLLLKKGYDFVVVESAGNGVKVEVCPDTWENIAIDATNNGFWASVTKDNVFGTTEEEKQDILDRIIIVGAAKRNEDGNYQQCVFSNGGERVDICAPGKDIYSTIINNKYDYKDGTSMAAPMVTGVCGMVWSVNSDFTGAEVKEIVCNYTSITVDDNPDGKHPLVNTYKMVNAKLAVEEAIKRTDNQGTVTGYVEEKETKKPLENITVTATCGDITRTAKTDKDGKFTIVLPVGQWKISVGSSSRIEDVKKDDNITLLNPFYVLTCTKVLGTVKDKATKSPLENATVEIILVEDELLSKDSKGNYSYTDFKGRDLVAKTTTDEEGNFSFYLPENNSYAIAVTCDNYETYIDMFDVQLKFDQIGIGDIFLAPTDSSGDNEDNRTVTASGNCGTDVSWVLKENGELIINGNGEIPNYSSGGAPWYKYASNIYFLIIEDGVTSIGLDAFWNLKNITDVTIPKSISKIARGAFELCDGLKSISILNSNCKIETSMSTIPYNCTIYGYTNSTAQEYANLYHIKFIALDEKNNTSTSNTADDNSEITHYITDLEFKITKSNVKQFLSGVISEITKYDVSLGSISVSHDTDGYEFMRAKVKIQTTGLEEDTFSVDFYPKRNSGSNRLYYINITSGYFRNENDSIYLSHKVIVEALEKYLSGETQYAEKVHTIKSFSYGKNGVTYYTKDDKYKCSIGGYENLMGFISYSYSISNQ